MWYKSVKICIRRFCFVFGEFKGCCIVPVFSTLKNPVSRVAPLIIPPTFLKKVDKKLLLVIALT